MINWEVQIGISIWAKSISSQLSELNFLQLFKGKQKEV